MTTIVAIKSDEEVIMGSDSLMSTVNETKRLANDSKIINNNGWLFGLAGDGKLDQYIKTLKFEINPENTAFEQLLYILDLLKDTIQDDPAVYNFEKGAMHGNLLIAFKNRLFEVDSYFSIDEISDFECCGTGVHDARGSLETLKLLEDENKLFEIREREGKLFSHKLTTEEKVVMAVKVASKHDVWTEPPVFIHSTSHEGYQIYD